MKFELIVFIITCFFIANTYYDGKYIEKIKSYSKYYKMLGIAFAGFSLYLFIRKDPNKAREMFSNANGIINSLPVDRQSAQMLAPILKLGGLYNSSNSNKRPLKYQPQPGPTSNPQPISSKIGNYTNKTKRAVSETKKKHCAANQQWLCKKCNKMLPATFEIDHIIRLDKGGSNDLSNLRALCPNCHRDITAAEYL